MPCTTILVGNKASYDGSTMIARNDDSGSAGHFTSKKFVIVKPEDQPRTYKCAQTRTEVALPETPMRYSAIPNVPKDKGIWAACGVNEKNVGMTATETISTNERVLGADPLTEFKDGHPELSEGIGEEDFVVLVLPYISSAREGVKRMGALLEAYGTYEMNGMAFSDSDEIWWMETIGGHHWMARRVPDECYAVIPNQLGLDRLELQDALGEQKEYMCSADLKEFIEENHLDLSLDEEERAEALNPRDAFGSHDDSDHVYNTPRAWYMLRYFNPHTLIWDGPDADYKPEDDDLPWCMVPEKKITTEDVKYILSSHYQGTPYDPYITHGDKSRSNMYRTIGINRTDNLSMVQIRPYLPEECRALQWIAFGSNVFNAFAPFYTNVNEMPDYLSSTEERVSTDNWYWTSRLIAALADASWIVSRFEIEHYAFQIQSEVRRVINESDRAIRNLAGESSPEGSDMQAQVQEVLSQANRKVADILKKHADETLDTVLQAASDGMKNRFSRADV